MHACSAAGTVLLNVRQRQTKLWLRTGVARALILLTEPVAPKGTRPDFASVVKSVPDPARRAKKARDREFVLSFLKAHGIQ